MNIFASIGLWPWLFLFALLYNLKWKKRSAGTASGATDYDRSLYGVAGQWKYTLCDAAFIYTAVLIPLELLPAKADDKKGMETAEIAEDQA